MADVLKLQSTAGMFDYPDPANPSKGTTEQQYIEFEKNKIGRASCRERV